MEAQRPEWAAAPVRDLSSATRVALAVAGSGLVVSTGRRCPPGRWGVAELRPFVEARDATTPDENAHSRDDAPEPCGTLSLRDGLLNNARSAAWFCTPFAPRTSPSPHPHPSCRRVFGHCR